MGTFKRVNGRLRGLMGFFSLLFVPGVGANTCDSLLLQDVVVSAGFTEKARLKATLPVEKIVQKQIQERIASNLVDVLNRTPGFSQVWEYHSPLLLRGMNSNRLIVVKNGARRIGTFPGGYFGQDLNVYEPGNIEVVKGPGSVMYGSGAISGIVHLVGSNPLGEASDRLRLMTSGGSNGMERMAAFDLCRKRETLGLSLHGKWRKMDDFSYADGSEADNSAVEDRDLSLQVAFQPQKQHRLTLHVDAHAGDWGKPRGFNGPTKMFTEIRNDETGLHSDVQYVYRPKAAPSASPQDPSARGLIEVKAELFFDVGSRDYYQYKYSEVTHKRSNLELVAYADRYGGGRAYAQWRLGDAAVLTTGSDVYVFRLDNPTTYVDYYNETTGSSPGNVGAGQSDVGFFAQFEQQLSSQWDWVGGLRWDGASVTEGSVQGIDGQKRSKQAFSGQVGLVFSPQLGHALRINLGRAFRMPITEELFTQTVSCKGIKQGNPQLDPETSLNLDLGYAGHLASIGLQWDVALFANRVNDYIVETAASLNEEVDFTYTNSDAVLYGGECSLGRRWDHVFRPGNWFQADLGIAYVYGIDRSVSSRSVSDSPLFGIPPLKACLDLRYTAYPHNPWVSSCYVLFQAEAAAAQNRIAAIPAGTEGGPWGYVPSEAHASFDLGGGIQLAQIPFRPQVRLMVKNAFNQSYKPFGSYLPVMGRNIKMSIKCVI